MDGSDNEQQEQHDQFIFRRMLNEVYLLMDFVSGRHDKSLTSLSGVRIPGQDSALTTADEIITHISTLRFPPEEFRPLTARNAAFLLIVKDQLNRIAKPAIGVTVAFTAMVVGSDREPHPDGTPRRRKDGTRQSLAAEAYPSLIRSALRMRRITIGAIALMLLLTVFTVYTSGVVSFGRSLIQRVEEVNRSAQATAESIKSIEMARGGERESDLATVRSASRSSGSAGFVRFCERPKLIRLQGDVMLFDDAQQRQVCDQLEDVTHKQALAYRDLGDFDNRQLYPYTLVGSFFSEVRVLLRPNGSDYKPREVAHETIAAILAVLGNYVLPMCFTLLGTGVSILRDIYTKMRDSTLAPRDMPLGFGRLALGMAAGAAIGLFFSPSNAPLSSASGLSGSLTLSAQGLAFLAGYGVDSVFAAFDGMLRRIAAATQTGKDA
jgi:hypothetical protein